MPKRKNRLREVLRDKGLKHAQAADLTGINRERFRKIVGNRVEILGWELMTMAEVFEVEERNLYEPAEIEVRTLDRSLLDGRDEASEESIWQACLAAASEESVLWLRQGLLQQEYLQEGPGFAQIQLEPGRILLGRAVEHIGTPVGEKKASQIAANQVLSIMRKEHEEDRKLSRFQLDLSFHPSRPSLTVYVQSSAVKIGQEDSWQIVQAGECAYLEDQDQLLLPNDKILQANFSRTP